MILIYSKKSNNKMVELWTDFGSRYYVKVREGRDSMTEYVGQEFHIAEMMFDLSLAKLDYEAKKRGG